MGNTEQNNGLESIDLDKYLSALWHWAWLVILSIIIAGVTAYLVSSNITPEYQANTTILVNESSSNKTIDTSSLQLSSQLSQTYSQMILKNPILFEVAQRLGIEDIDPLKLSAKAVSGTQLINITAKSYNPELAAIIANEIVAVFSEDVQSLQAARFSTSKQSLENRINDIENQIIETSAQIAIANDPIIISQLTTKLDIYKQTYTSFLESLEQIRLAEDQMVSTIVQVEPAIPPEKPIRPNVMLYTALASGVGLVLALCAIFIINFQDDTLKSPEDISGQLNLPVLGIISHFGEKISGPITKNKPSFLFTEAFRNLRTNLIYAKSNNGHPIQTVLITSIMAGEGKSTIAANLGLVLAQNRHNVILLDADLRRPKLHSLLGISNNYGLSDVFDFDEAKLLAKLLSNNLLRPTRIKNLSIVTAGKCQSNPATILDSENIQSILKVLNDRSEMVLIDTPPTLAVSDAAALVPYVDGVILVMKPGSTKIGLARQVVEQLDRIGANLLGVVLNDIKPNKLDNRYTYSSHFNKNPANKKT